MRVEMIYPVIIPDTPGTQFYVACAQVNVIGPSGGKPTQFVKFPGTYTKDTPGVKVEEDKFGYPLDRNLNQFPIIGPAVWTG